MYLYFLHYNEIYDYEWSKILKYFYEYIDIVKNYPQDIINIKLENR